MRWVLVLCVLSACSARKREKQEAGDRRQETGDAGSGSGCVKEVFAGAIQVPEASGAVWVEASFGLPAHLVVIGDSGTKGSFVVVDEAGAELARGALPLDPGASDDLEGLARVGDVYYALTSGGQMRQWKRTAADRFELTEK